MPVVSVVLAGLMMRSRGAIRLGMRIACRRTPTAIGFRGYSLWTPDSRECGYSVRIQCVRLHDRAIRTRGSPGSDKLESVCTGCELHVLSSGRRGCLCVYIHVCLCMCMGQLSICVCVSERGSVCVRERECVWVREREKERECVCVFVCVSERERE